MRRLASNLIAVAMLTTGTLHALPASANVFGMIQTNDNGVGPIDAATRQALGLSGESPGQATLARPGSTQVRQTGRAHRAQIELVAPPSSAHTSSLAISQAGVAHKASVYIAGTGNAAVSIDQQSNSKDLLGSTATVAIQNASMSALIPESPTITQQGMGNSIQIQAGGTDQAALVRARVNQRNLSSTATGNSHQLTAPSLNGTLELTISQDGQGNTANFSFQAGAGTLTTTQYGNNNSASLTSSQTAGSLSFVVSQTGNSNEATAAVQGAGHNINSTQIGDNNILRAELSGSGNVLRHNAYGDYNAVGSGCTTGSAPSCTGNATMNGQNMFLQVNLGTNLTATQTGTNSSGYIALEAHDSSLIPAGQDMSRRNIVEATMSGQNHAAAIVAIGNDNTIKVNQSGNRGSNLVLGVTGSNNTVTATQVEVTNTYAGHQATFRLIGSNNSATLNQTSAIAPLNVTIQGNNLTNVSVSSFPMAETMPLVPTVK